MLKLKLQYFGCSCEELTYWKVSNAGRDWGQEETGTTEDEMAGWHHSLDGHESEWTPGVGDGQRGLTCCDSWGHKESDMTEQLNWTELNEIGHPEQLPKSCLPSGAKSRAVGKANVTMLLVVLLLQTKFSLYYHYSWNNFQTGSCIIAQTIRESKSQ